MLLDVERNQRFENAIHYWVYRHFSSSTNDPLRVIDLGCGSGLLSAFVIESARALGRSDDVRLYSIEANAHRAELARETLRKHGVANAKVIHKISTQVKLTDLDGCPCNLLVSETLGTFPHYERVQVFVSDLFERGLLCDASPTVPMTMRLFATPYALKAELSRSGVASVYAGLLAPGGPFVMDRDVGMCAHQDILLRDGRSVHIIPERRIRDDFAPFDTTIEVDRSKRCDAVRVLVAEWECTLAPGITLSNTVGSVSRLDAHAYASRIHNWGFNLLRLPDGGNEATLTVRVTCDGVDVKRVTELLSRARRKRKRTTPAERQARVG